MYEYDILCGIWKAPFEIPPKYLSYTLKDMILCNIDILRAWTWTWT